MRDSAIQGALGNAMKRPLLIANAAASFELPMYPTTLGKGPPYDKKKCWSKTRGLWVLELPRSYARPGPPVMNMRIEYFLGSSSSPQELNVTSVAEPAVTGAGTTSAGTKSERARHTDAPWARLYVTSKSWAVVGFEPAASKRIESASFKSHIQGDTRQARFGCLGQARKNSLSGVSRMSTIVCCELSRAKQVVVRDARLR